MSKLSFRARALDASKPLPVFRCEDLPDLAEYASINRAVPQMPTGMEKEEESVRETPPPPPRPGPSIPPAPGAPTFASAQAQNGRHLLPALPARRGGGGRTDGRGPGEGRRRAPRPRTAPSPCAFLRPPLPAARAPR